MTLSQRFQRKVVFILDKIRSFIENENNADMLTNGEARFLRSLNSFYRDKIIVLDIGSASGAYSSFLPKAEVFKFDGRQNYLISNINGTLTFYIRDNAPELSSVNRLAYLDDKYGPVTKTEMQARRLDTIIEEDDIKHISLLKIDVEGHELHVLHGLGDYLRNNFIDFIQFERGNAEADSRLKTLYDLLESKGFEVRKMYRYSIKKVPYMSQNENLNYANYVAVSKLMSYR